MSSPNKTRVQVATDNTFSNIIVDEIGDYKTVLAMASAELPVGSNLYIRGMHGHPTTGDSPWSAVHQFKVMLPYANELYYTAGDYTFTVPANVTEICIAATPGADYSSAGELLKAYTGKTVACIAGNNAVPPGISSITLSGKGANGTTTTNVLWNYKWRSFSAGIAVTEGTYPAQLTGSVPPASITAKVGPTTRTFNRVSYNTVARYEFTFNDSEGDPVTAWIEYDKSSSNSYTTGAATTCVVNGTTYTFPGGNGGAAAVTNHTVAINPATGATISVNIAAGGSLSYSYSAYAINALGTLLGNNFTLSPVAANVGVYKGGIAAWRNAIPVVPGSTIPVRVGFTGAVNIIWGTGRSFPNSEA